MHLLFLFILSIYANSESTAAAHIYPVDPTELEDLFDTYPSVVLYYSTDSAGVSAREQFAISSHDLGQYGVLLGDFNCTNSTDICKQLNLTKLPALVFYEFATSFLSCVYRPSL